MRIKTVVFLSPAGWTRLVAGQHGIFELTADWSPVFGVVMLTPIDSNIKSAGGATIQLTYCVYSNYTINRWNFFIEYTMAIILWSCKPGGKLETFLLWHDD